MRLALFITTFVWLMGWFGESADKKSSQSTILPMESVERASTQWTSCWTVIVTEYKVIGTWTPFFDESGVP